MRARVREARATVGSASSSEDCEPTGGWTAMRGLDAIVASGPKQGLDRALKRLEPRKYIPAWVIFV